MNLTPQSWAWLLAAFLRPGAASVALLRRAACEILTPTQWRLLAATAQVWLARFQCWRLGVKTPTRPNRRRNR
jgi:hypothetical protein